MSSFPLRKVARFEYTGASRYTGYRAKSVKLFLECGHENFRKASQGVPERAQCRACHYAALRAAQQSSTRGESHNKGE